MTKSAKIYTNIYLSKILYNNGNTQCHGICCVIDARNVDKKTFYAMYDSLIRILELHYNTTYIFDFIVGGLLNLILFFL